ncbi:MAG: hypothetical protein PHO03_05915 [Candidatus Omnitrophica bacterium]|nr:hypothetical protein [Candidatus Omnitrophota bacterium]
MKLKYSIDSRNQLLVKSPKSKTPLTPCGIFSVNKNNQLEYWLNEPPRWRAIYNLPKKLVFEGSWSLNANHDLELKLSKTAEQSEGERLVLKGDIISVDNNILAFEVVSRQTLRILKLSGAWQADEANRLVFQVEKKAFPDELIFKAGWQLNKNQQLEYTYTKTRLATKSKINQSFTFKGFWKIDSRHKLVYILAHSPDARFDFKVQLENPNIYPQDKAIKYRVGMGLRQPKGPDYRLITLYGEWKFKRNLGLIFSMDYGNHKVQEAEFGAELTFERNKFVFSLKDRRGEPLGITLTYSYSLLNALEPRVFIRLKAIQKELGVEAGFSIPF